MKTEVIVSEKEKLAQTRARLEKRQRLVNELERKVKIRKTIELGDLIIKAGLDDFDSQVLLGALLEIKALSTEKSNVKRWSERQVAWLNSNQPQRLIVSFQGESSSETTDLLRSKKFRWNSFRQEWYGFGKKDELQTLLGKDNAKIIEVPG